MKCLAALWLLSISGQRHGMEQFRDYLHIDEDIILSKAVEDAIEKTQDVHLLEKEYKTKFETKKNSYNRNSAVAKSLSDTAEILELATANMEGRTGRSRRAARSGLRGSISQLKYNLEGGRTAAGGRPWQGGRWRGESQWTPP